MIEINSIIGIGFGIRIRMEKIIRTAVSLAPGTAKKNKKIIGISNRGVSTRPVAPGCFGVPAQRGAGRSHSCVAN